ncbi:tyrosine-type recombinase/integrase [Magnetofaba australis]|uniref:tyrosine-type recombinase/integrase n=1 Tax=Magnetofaba australis TaxID=1472297 RepID=UPI0023BA338D|nr:site-specific integrase [Magnetofaba australis]
MVANHDKPREDILEGDEFGVCVSQSGRKTFFSTFKFEGRKQRLGLGPYPTISVAEARQKYAEARSQVERGINPCLSAMEAKAERLAAPSVADLAEMYLERWARPRKAARSAAEDERMLRRDVLPKWGGRKPKSIKRADVVALLDGIQERGANIAANRTLAVVRHMFNWSVKKGILESSPATSIEAPAKEGRKEHALNSDEIRLFWRALDEARMEPATAAALRLTLATCQRSGEVTQMRWEEIHGDWWVIPGDKTKNGRPHRVYLNSVARDILATLPRSLGWVIPSARKSVGPMHQNALSHALRNNAWFDLPRFSPHDLRRTGATQLSLTPTRRMRVRRDVAPPPDIYPAAP